MRVKCREEVLFQRLNFVELSKGLSIKTSTRIEVLF